MNVLKVSELSLLGTYELNIEKLANSDERVVGIGVEGNYLLDLHSMIKPGKSKKNRKKS